ncbi:hypothetical protein CARUB_v10010913mg [Capsella rubella]|uniref:AAA+ ATPase domain-containing protein n=1 Tax=Capsella rubella TaxID=81985 RepID=R0IDZ1_9BRAS|nr:hypothetical protein CARUB_v10010913mg [Capsella rubella]
MRRGRGRGRGRGGGGGGMGGGINRRYLSQVIDSCGRDLTTAEDIVDDLRSRYGNFARLTRQVLLLNVRQIVNARNNKAKEEDDNNNGDEQAVATTKRKKVSPSPSSSSTSEDEDAVYSEKLSPRFDLINDSLRDNYAKLNSSSKKPIENVEVETVSNKGRSKVATMGLRKEANGSLSVSGTTANGDLEVVDDKGPTFKDFGGIKKVLDELEMNVLFPILNPEPFKRIGVKPPSGILFHGPPGCGKTKLANAIANEIGVPFYKISATDVVSGVSGASEENIRELFSKAYRTAPSIVFIDEIDAIGSKRENQQREMEKRIVTQLLTCMDGPGNKGPESSAGFVLVIGATNRPDALDPALRRSGRFECEIALSVPDEDARAEILSVVAQKLRLEGPFDKKTIARLTPGFVGADLEGVANMAGRITTKRILDTRKSQLSANGEDDNSWLRHPWPEEELDKLFVKMSDFETLIAKAAANEAGANFMHIKGAELLNKYVGESELAIRTLFQRARTCSPCVIFFDEVDALTTSRGKEGAWVVERLLNQFLVELDGGDRHNVYVIGATNRPDVIDPAFLRPGRFGNLLYVPLPSADERASILKAIARKKPIDASVDLDGIAKMRCEGFSGADLAHLVQKATFVAVEEITCSSEDDDDDVTDSTKCSIKMTHFEQALSLVSPSVNTQQRRHYEELSKKLQESIGRKA